LESRDRKQVVKRAIACAVLHRQAGSAEGIGGMTRPIPERESLTVEFKSDRDRLNDRDLIAAVVCLANTEGGELYVGVEDDGTVTGLHAAHGNVTGLTAMIASSTVPPLSVRVEALDVEGRRVAKVVVPKFYRTPLLKTFERVEEQFNARVVEQEIEVDLFRVPIPNYDHVALCHCPSFRRCRRPGPFANHHRRGKAPGRSIARRFLDRIEPHAARTAGRHFRSGARDATRRE